MTDIPTEQPLIEEEDTGKEMYCFICEDGGKVIECSLCRRNFCYSKLGDEDDHEHPACVTVPEQMAEDVREKFPCPECLSLSQARFAPYIINRGSRATLRIKGRTSLVIIIFCIASLAQDATALCEQLAAALGVFEVNIATMCTRLDAGVSLQEEQLLRSQLIPEAPFHLALIFLTESHPGARGADTVRMFGASCGRNLLGDGVIDSIQRHLQGSRILSLVVPTAPSLLYCDYLHIFPQLFLSLYYLGTDVRSTLYQTWGRSEEVRCHTGLIVFDRQDRESPFACTRLCHAPCTSRPLGVQLPAAWTICGCPGEERPDKDWLLLKERPHGKETIFWYKSACCGVQLTVAVFPFKRRGVKRNEEHYIEEDWQPFEKKFPFTDSTMIRMKIEKPDAPNTWRSPCLGSLWTIAGRAAAAKR